MDQNFNPIRSVDGDEIPCPSKYDWKLSDVSAADAGRTEDGLMHKMKIAQKVHLELEWQNVSDTVASTVLSAFQPQYIDVRYYDYRTKSFQTKEFYVGDRSVTSHNRTRGISTVSFNIIER